MSDDVAENEAKASASAPVAATAPVSAPVAIATALKAAPPVSGPVAAKRSTITRAGKLPAKKPVATKPAAVATAARPTLKNLSARKPAANPAKEIKMADTIQNITDKTQTVFAEANDRAKGAMQKGAKAFEDMNSFSKGNIEAAVESSKIAAKGAEEIVRYSVDYARGAVEKANANVRKLASVKSPTEFFQLQSEFAREAMDSVASEGAKFTENYLKLLGAVAQPYQNRFAVAAEKMKVAA